MASTSSQTAVALVVVLCFVSFVSFANCKDDLFAEGKVYCDTCRVQFETKLTEYISGARVKMECRNRENEHNITFTSEGVTDASGAYAIPVEGDHEEDICEVTVVHSPREDCNEIANTANRARVMITKNNGAASPLRFVNPLGVMKKEALPNCGEILRELGFVPLD